MRAVNVMERVERYLGVPAVVGFEGPFLRLLASELRGRGAELLERPGLLVARGGGAGVVSAHIDRHGLVVHEDGLVYAAAYAKHVRNGVALRLGPKLRAAVCARFDAEPVYAYDPATGERIAEGSIRHEAACGFADDLVLDAEGLDGITQGTPVAYSHRCRHEDGWFRGQLDNVISAAIAVELLDAGFDGTVLFTAEEEIGHSWERALAWFDEVGGTQQLLVLDTSPFDEPDLVADGVVVLRNRDANGVFDAGLVGALREAVAGVGARAVMKDEQLAAAGKPLGSTELGRLVAGSGGRVTGATVQLPTTDYHTNEEATTPLAIEQLVATLAVVLA